MRAHSYVQSYYGAPFIWYMLNNFGGNNGMWGAFILCFVFFVIDFLLGTEVGYGVYTAQQISHSRSHMDILPDLASDNFPSLLAGPTEARAAGSSIAGVGLTPEGIFHNAASFDLMTENAWRMVRTFKEKNWQSVSSVFWVMTYYYQSASCLFRVRTSSQTLIDLHAKQSAIESTRLCLTLIFLVAISSLAARRRTQTPSHPTRGHVSMRRGGTVRRRARRKRHLQMRGAFLRRRSTTATTAKWFRKTR